MANERVDNRLINNTLISALRVACVHSTLLIRLGQIKEEFVLYNLGD